MVAKHRGPEVLCTMPATTVQEETDLIELRRFEDRRAIMTDRDDPPAFPRIDHRDLIERKQLHSAVDRIRASLGRGVKTKRIVVRAPDGVELELSEVNARNFERKTGYVRVGERPPQRPQSMPFGEPDAASEQDLHDAIDRAVDYDASIADYQRRRRRDLAPLIK